MKQFRICDDYQADCHSDGPFHTGEIYHSVSNADGGQMLTPIARYFIWHPVFIEGFEEHWHIDCYVRTHDLAPDPERLGKRLVSSLKEQGICDEPIWVSWFESNELGGEAYGQVFEDE